MANNAANERVFINIDDHVVNSRKVNLESSSMNDQLFLQCLEKEALKFD